MQARYTGDMGVHNPVEHLAHELGDPLLVHLPHVAVPVGVGHLEVLELVLQVLVGVRVRVRVRVRVIGLGL